MTIAEIETRLQRGFPRARQVYRRIVAAGRPGVAWADGRTPILDALSETSFSSSDSVSGPRIAEAPLRHMQDRLHAATNRRGRMVNATGVSAASIWWVVATMGAMASQVGLRFAALASGGTVLAVAAISAGVVAAPSVLGLGAIKGGRAARTVARRLAHGLDPRNVSVRGLLHYFDIRPAAPSTKAPTPSCAECPQPANGLRGVRAVGRRIAHYFDLQSALRPVGCGCARVNPTPTVVREVPVVKAVPANPQVAGLS